MAKIEVKNDKWFDYYACSKCGHKIQLTICNDPLPGVCWGCGEKLELPDESKVLEVDML